MRLREASLAALLIAVLPAVAGAQGRTEVALERAWSVGASALTSQTGAELSRAGSRLTGGYPATMPATVVGVLHQNGVIAADPFYGMNLRTVPGTDYELGKDFFTLPMPAGSPFRASWWFRRDFAVPASAAGGRVHLKFNGISYSANVWVNGRRIATSDQVAGTSREHDFDVTEAVTPGQSAGVAVEVFAPEPKDLGSTWVDWNPVPGDKGMGLFQSVKLVVTGPVRLGTPSIKTVVAKPSLASADVEVAVEVANESAQPVDGVVRGSLGALAFSRAVRLAAGQKTLVTFNQRVASPRLWWPVGMGAPDLHALSVAFEISGEASGGALSDRVDAQVGLREFTSELTANQSRLFRVNGRPLFLKGAGWTPDLLGRVSLERQRQELEYVRDLGLNMVRLEGKFEENGFLDLADRMGILVMPGWVCCSRWEQTADWTSVDMAIAQESMRSQLKRHRLHASVFVFLYGSDEVPADPVEQMYLRVAREERWPHPTVAAASTRTSTVGITGMKMNGPYEYVPPSYWSIDTRFGGAFGFNGESSVGPAPPPLESLRRFIPAANLWPIDEVWNYHAGENEFKTIDVFRGALAARYGAPTSVEEFSVKAQAMAYDGHRAMFEAYAREKFVKTTGIVQWMLGNAWPSLIWHLYDFYLNPAGSYFGAKKANEPLHLMYSHSDDAITLVNGTQAKVDGLRARVGVYDFALTPKFQRDVDLSVDADASKQVLKLPRISGLSATYFVKLDLLEAATGRRVSGNFYWLSTQKEVFDWDATEFTHTPLLRDADLTLLNRLAPARVSATAATRTDGSDRVTRVELENPAGNPLAFMVRLRVLKGAGGEDVLPVRWEDNYVSLMPGERRSLEARYAAADLGSATPTVRIEGWNAVVEEIAAP